MHITISCQKTNPIFRGEYCRFGSEIGSFYAFKNSMVIAELLYTSSGAIYYYRRVSDQLLRLVFA
jgi:hypothetical protein